MIRKVGGQRIEDIRKQYPGYYQKKGNWKKKLIAKKSNSIELNKDINLQIFNTSANRLDENINKLFKLL
jgi:hypothetical protein